MGAMRRLMVAVCSSLAATATICAPSAAQCNEVLGWTQLSNAGPSGRGRHSIAVDTARNRAVLFGGVRELSGFQRPRDTWEWDGTQWTQVSSVGPAGRNDGAMAFHAGIGKVVLFGGYAPGLLGDTWTWDGAVWQQLSIPGPSARQFHAMAYDPIRAEILLFGGWAPLTGDTWVFNGTSWSQRVVAGPGARLDAKMVWDPTRSAIILHGGNTDAFRGQPLNDTWSWNGTSWAQITATGGPGSGGFDMAFDSRVGGIVALRDDRTWLLQGSSWTEILPGNPSGLPSSRGNHVMWTDPETGAVNLHGGYPDLTDTWELIVKQGGYEVPDCFATIQAAIDAVPTGVQKIISVAPGTYNQSFSLNGKNVIVRGAAGNTTILNGAGLTTSIARFTGGEPATAGLENLVFRNGTVGSRFTPKSTFTIGGAIYANNSSAFIRSCRFENCRADFGGAIYQYQGTMDWDDLVFVGNTANNEGGGALVYNVTGSATTCTFSGNRCGVVGPGSGSAFKAVGAFATGQSVVLENCTITNNIALDFGAAVEFYEHVKFNPGVLRLVGCTISGNTSGDPIANGPAGLRVLGSQSSCVLSGGTSICGNATDNVAGPYLIEGSATVCDCEGDLSGNGQVDAADLGILLSVWGTAPTDGQGDLNHDGFVTAADLSALLVQWGACPN